MLSITIRFSVKKRGSFIIFSSFKTFTLNTRSLHQDVISRTQNHSFNHKKQFFDFALAQSIGKSFFNRFYGISSLQISNNVKVFYYSLCLVPMFFPCLSIEIERLLKNINAN